MAILFDEQGRPITQDNPLPVSTSGSNGERELQGPVASRPAADSVPVNSTFFALDEGKLYWTDGNTWAEVGA